MVPAPPAPPRAPVVLVCDKLSAAGLAVLAEAGVEARPRTAATDEELLAEVGDVDGILVRSATRVTEAVLAAGTRLRAVGRAGIGVDNIDIAAATRHGVVVMNTPTANAITTAELAIAHLLALARHLPASDRSMKEGRWDKSAFVGTELTGKTIVVVGLGKIGRVVAERALGLRMRVLAHDPFLRGDSPVSGVELVDWDTALREADVLTLHVPRTKDTLRLVDAAALAAMKPTAWLINCARGGIVVEEDLVRALQAGGIARAALDVFEHEPLPPDSPLRARDDVVLTPHLGASSDEAQERVATEIARQMVAYLVRDEAHNALNAPALAADALAALRPWITLARRCGSLLGQVAGSPPARVDIVYGGQLLGHDTEAIRRAVVAGLLSPSLDAPVNVVNAPLVAEERGVEIFERRDEHPERYADVLRLEVTGADGSRTRVAGAVYRGQPRLLTLDGFGLDAVPEGEMLLTEHHDRPGVLGLVASWLGERGVNIEALHMGAPLPGRDLALALYQLGRALDDVEVTELEGLPPIVRAQAIHL